MTAVTLLQYRNIFTGYIVIQFERNFELEHNKVCLVLETYLSKFNLFSIPGLELPNMPKCLLQIVPEIPSVKVAEDTKFSILKPKHRNIVRSVCGNVKLPSSVTAFYWR